MDKSKNKDSSKSKEEITNPIELDTNPSIGLSADTLYDYNSTFESIGVCKEICDTLKGLNYKHPTKIQKETIDYALKGNDIIGIAETGSGKTAAFGIPILQNLLKNPQKFFALIITPTRELALQISQHIEALGALIGVRTTVLVGGLDSFAQAMSLSKNPHIVVGTPGQITYHLAHTNKFTLSGLKYLVFDEADKLLINTDFERAISQILAAIPEDRSTFLFSATLTAKVENLRQASLKNPVKIQVSSSYQTVDTLVQNYIFIPLKYKEAYLAYLLNEFNACSVIVFTETCLGSIQVTLMLRNLGFKAISLNGKMTQSNRIGALNKFKSGERRILVATDVANRGLDISGVDLVLNYDMPQQTEDYIHRVGRTARAGRTGRAISFVTQYDIESIQKIESNIGKKLLNYEIEEKKVLLLLERVLEASRFSKNEIKEVSKGLKTSEYYETNPDEDDDEGNRIESLLKAKKPSSKNKPTVGNHSFVKKKRKRPY